jgi:pimeloyl-ACP methyl ester carboxylesterase
MSTSNIKFILVLALYLALAGPTKAQVDSAPSTRDYYPVISILYGTDRELKNNTFTSKSSPVLNWGQAQFVLHLHYFRKSDRDQTWWQPGNSFKNKPGLKSISPLDEKNFNHALRQDTQNETFLFVHGFSTTFEEGAKEAAQIAYDLQLPGKPLLYSWPSHGNISVGDYKVDQATVNRPEEIGHLKSFIQQSLKESGRGRVNLIGFSMGTYLLTRALMELAEEGENFSKVGSVILISADIDAQDFKNLYYPQLKPVLGSKLVLYVSGRDKALQLSEAFHHGQPRLGQGSEKITLIDGLTTIDATQSSQDCGICHGLSQINGVINDMYLSLHQDLPLNKRLVDGYEKNGGKYYVLFDDAHSIETIEDHNFAIAGQLGTYLNNLKLIWLPDPALEIAAGVNHGFLPTQLELRWNLETQNLRFYLNAGVDYYDQGNNSTAWALHGGPGVELVSDSGLGLGLEWDGVAELSRSSAVLSGSYLDRFLNNDGFPFSGFRLQLIKYFDFTKLLN